MKRLMLVLLVLVLLRCASAQANGWGLTGNLLNVVSRAKTWDDYSSLSNQAGGFAVMASRYHNALFYVDDNNQLHVYTTAVYQPDAKRGAPALKLNGQTLQLSYGTDEVFIFRPAEDGFGYMLDSAMIGDFQLDAVWENGRVIYYETSEPGSASYWPVSIRLAEFNIELMPHTVDEVQRMQLTMAQVSHSQCLGSGDYDGSCYSPDQPGSLVQPKKKGTVPVYSAPFGKSAWRAGNGKAAVGLNGDLWVLSSYKNADGDSYACIRYEVSQRTQRIGYALCSDLGLPEVTDWEPDEPLYGFAHVDVEAVADTFLTDDPDVGQYQQFQVPEGTGFSCMGLYNAYYAYVGAEVKNGRFVDGGAIVWGFVPIRYLQPMPLEVQEEAMQQLVGSWRLDAGGSLGPDFLVFHEDGTFTAGVWDWELDSPERTEAAAELSGTWTVTKYNPFMNLYWNRPPYQLTLIYQHGAVSITSLDITDEGFSLTNEEGGGGYVPATEEEVQLTEEHG